MLEYASDDFDSSIPAGDLYLPTYLRNDVSYQYRLRDWLRLSAAVDNLFNKANENYVGQPGVGRRVRIGVDAHF